MLTNKYRVCFLSKLKMEKKKKKTFIHSTTNSMLNDGTFILILY